MVRARDVHLHASCHIEGIIMHEAISIEDGAFIDGTCKRTDKLPGHDNMESGGSEPIDLLENLRLITA